MLYGFKKKKQAGKFTSLISERGENICSVKLFSRQNNMEPIKTERFSVRGASR